MSKRICGVDVGGTKIEALVLNQEHKVCGKARLATPTTDGPNSVVNAIIEAITAAADDAGCKTNDLLGIGIGAPGAVDASAGMLMRAPNIPGFDKP
ncbi:MAG: ROK family protein, partial [Thermoleophilia bacterium]|nr:ROK family protein [Thermoleophilia bacterium]